ncbi:uncharacterized protein LOC126656135 isoform X2 [Mercurialis annua]|uniref:uncharacterized protein LOC126656135 isoform X2 n=1 Tax=Mercurialis annua TaxID=3986 RepID=UPI00215ED0AE|nr:uncharacterized protein LOC126656135 isoform X2 [Mercurialis annua]
MGCFLACFGSSKDDRRRRKHRYKVQPREQRNTGSKPVQFAVPFVHNNPENSTSPVSETLDSNPEEQLKLSPKKKVTFDSVITTYDHVSVKDSTELCVEKGDGAQRKGEEKEKQVVKPSQVQSLCSEDSSITSSSGSYPSNHRYENCRDSDDELDYGESDVEDAGDDEDEDDDDDSVLDLDDEYEDDRALGSSGYVEKEVKPNLNARDRSGYVHSVLNPVENLTQWKAVKAKGTPPLKQQKENQTLGQEPRSSFSSEPSRRELSFSFKAKSDQSKTPKQEIAVDASLSNWLGSSESTPLKKASSKPISFDTNSPEKSTLSVGSNSPCSFDDRPILGALTLEELKQYSATNSPRRSPGHSPDEMAIIGTVGSYWNDNVCTKNSSGSASSFKGIPNTTSKYREDKRVNWHSTPFETRLERALNSATAEAYCIPTSNNVH